MTFVLVSSRARRAGGHARRHPYGGPRLRQWRWGARRDQVLYGAVRRRCTVRLEQRSRKAEPLQGGMQRRDEHVRRHERPGVQGPREGSARGQRGALRLLPARPRRDPLLRLDGQENRCLPAAAATTRPAALSTPPAHSPTSPRPQPTLPADGQSTTGCSRARRVSRAPCTHRPIHTRTPTRVHTHARMRMRPRTCTRTYTHTRSSCIAGARLAAEEYRVTVGFFTISFLISAVAGGSCVSSNSSSLKNLGLV